MAIRQTLERLWAKVFVLACTLIAMLPISPWNMVNPYRDSGVFLYIGWRILNGELPYRDIWDHKPPVIFYLNALGVALGGNSRWGIWIIELVFVLVAAWVGFRICQRAFGSGPAVIALFLWLLTLEFVIQGGNLTTEYTLPIQFACLALFWRAEERPSLWLWPLLGALFALAFFTKQTTVGVGIAIILYLVIDRIKAKRGKTLLKEVALIGLGAGVVGLLVVAFFAAQGALSDFWSAAFQYNFVYAFSPTSVKTRLHPLLWGIEPLTKTSLFQFALMGVLIALLMLLYRWRMLAHCRVLLTVALLDFPIELILVSTSARIYPHYYMALLPILSIFAAVALWAFFTFLKNLRISRRMIGLFTAGILFSLAWSVYAGYKRQVKDFHYLEPDPAVLYLKTSSSPDDYVLLWGAETSVNFVAQRRGPSRFVYQYPLYQQGYVTQEMIEEFLNDIIRTHPIIIDTKHGPTPMYQFPIMSDAIQEKIDFLQAHYCVVDSIGDWTVYRYHDHPCPSNP